MTDTLDVSAVADAVASAVSVPPPPLPVGWIMKESRSNPDHYYYYNIETGMHSWNPPYDPSLISVADLDKATTNNSSNDKGNGVNKTEASVAAKSYTNKDGVYPLAIAVSPTP